MLLVLYLIPLILAVFLLSRCKLRSYLLCLLKIGRTNPNENTTNSAMTGTENIWFGGVDKKLVEMNVRQANLVEGNDKSLLTKTPLKTFSALSSKKKHSINNDDRSSSEPSTSKKEKGKKEKDSLLSPNSGITQELAMDCEMVECYHHKSVLARVSIVNLFGHPLLDRYVAPPSKVTDYRTRFSGIRRNDLVNAPSFEEVQEEVARLIKGRIVVGHAIHNDFSVLKLSHPPELTRDTSHYYKYLFQGKTPSLKKLSESVLGIKIQKGEHDSVQDAQATMKLYVKEREKWNKNITKPSHHAQHAQKKQKTKPKKKKIKTFYVMT